METNFKVVVAVYNSEKWIGKNLKMLESQTYEDWKGIVIDDCSTDDTQEVIVGNLPEKMNAIFNTTRYRALYNQVKGIRTLGCNDEDVIVIVDGDDWLADKKVLEKLAKYYTNSDIWMTYGSYMIYPSAKRGRTPRPIPFEEMMGGKLQPYDSRRGHWIFSHLRTFKYFLFKNLRDEDFMYSGTNEYLRASADAAIMKPLVELAGRGHIRYIEEILYMYNFGNPIRDGLVNHRDQSKCAREVANKPRYEAKSKKQLIRGIW